MDNIYHSIPYRIEKDYIPIGSVEYVLDALSQHYDIYNIKPINIPQELMKPEYLKRWVKIRKTEDTTINAGETPIFVKDNTKIKGYCNIITKNFSYPAGEWLVSEFVDIKSEWRAFVFKDQLVGLQNYSGDFTLFPDVNLINQMIDENKGKNPAYTLDVGVNVVNGTFLIECHDFFSCGLYGFSDYIALPRMFITTWNKLIGSK